MKKSPQSPAWVVTSRGSLPVRCMVSGLVPTGGRISVEAGIVVPDRFALYSSLRSNRGRQCRVIKRDGRVIEFEFLATKADQERMAQKSGATR